MTKMKKSASKICILKLKMDKQNKIMESTTLNIINSQMLFESHDLREFEWKFMPCEQETMLESLKRLDHELNTTNDTVYWLCIIFHYSHNCHIVNRVHSHSNAVLECRKPSILVLFQITLNKDHSRRQSETQSSNFQQ